MGIRARAEALVRGLDGRKEEGGNGLEKVGVEERKKGIREAVERLVSRVPGRGMGTLYKVLAIVPERGGRRPVGFGGDVAG